MILLEGRRVSSRTNPPPVGVGGLYLKFLAAFVVRDGTQFEDEVHKLRRSLNPSPTTTSIPGQPGRRGFYTRKLTVECATDDLDITPVLNDLLNIFRMRVVRALQALNKPIKRLNDLELLNFTQGEITTDSPFVLEDPPDQLEVCAQGL